MKRAQLLIAAALFLTACTQKTQNEAPAINLSKEAAAVAEDITAATRTEKAQNEAPFLNLNKDIALYNNEGLQISFNHPSDWRAVEENSIVWISARDGSTSLSVPGESFEEFENRNREWIENKLMDIIETGNIYPSKASEKYPTKMYRSHEGQHYIIEIDGHYLNLTTSEFDLYNNPPQDNRNKEEREQYKENLDIIISSLSFL